MGGFLRGRESKQKQAQVAEHQHVGQNEPEYDEGKSVVIVSLAVRCPFVDLDEDQIAVDCPGEEEWYHEEKLEVSECAETFQLLPGERAQYQVLLIVSIIFT